MDYVIKFKTLNLEFGICEKTATVTAENENDAREHITNKFLVTEFISVLKKS